MKIAQKLRKGLFYGTYFKRSDINKKPLISSQDKIITKFVPKKMGDFGFGQSIPKLLEN